MKAPSVKCAICHIAVGATDIIHHYVDEHKISGLDTCEYFNFDDEDSFLKWKKSIEKTTVCQYNKECRHSRNRNSWKYICHRSGEFQTGSKGIRNLKTQGTKKIDGFCPAYIYKQNVGDKIQVSFMKTHVGHENELSHVNISPSKKVEIASKLAQKIPKRDILNNIRDSFDGKELQRTHIITLKDISNIAEKYNLKDYKRDQSDGISVDVIVNEKQSEVLYYKPQDSIDPSNIFLKKENFVLILMNDAQCEMLKKFGNNIIAVDGTHGTGYDFTLHTLIVMDELHQGFPVASMISDRKDTSVLNFFFSHVKQKIGGISIEPNVFMSDMADELYKAWKEVMGVPRHRLFCSWHVIKRWKENLNKIKNKDKQDEMYKILRCLLEELDENKFNVMLAKLLEKFDTDTELKEFQDYFLSSYVSRTELWAYCFRHHLGINTNMSLERIHKTIKYYFLQAKCCQRLDKFLHYFFEFLRDRLFDRIIMQQKGKVSYKLRELRKRHKKVNSEMTVTAEENIYLVNSKDTIYFVSQHVECIPNCKLRCNQCNTCIHKFICTCLDSSIKWNMCKHIHTVCQYINNMNSSNRTIIFPGIEPTHTNSDSLEGYDLDLDLHLQEGDDQPQDNGLLRNEDGPTSNNLLQEASTTGPTNEQLRQMHEEIVNDIIKTEKDRLIYASFLQKAKERISIQNKTLDPPQFISSVKVNPKKNIDKQRRLYSTKKKPQKSQNTRQIPSAQERNDFYFKSL